MLALKKETDMGSDPAQLDTRVARLEIHMEHMSSNINRILSELHDLRISTEARFEVVNQKFDAVNERISAMHVSMTEKLGEIKVWALTVLGGGVGFGILTVIARAFHWI